MKVLIIEDDKWQAELYESLCRTRGHEPRCIAGGQEALDSIDEWHPDGIVLDMMLADGTGMSVLHELQSYSDTVAIPVVVCTNLAEQLSDEALRPYGVVRVLDKTQCRPQDIFVLLEQYDKEKV